MFLRVTCLITFSCLAAAGVAAEIAAIATLVDGDVGLVRHTSRWALKSGARLRPLDLIETASNAGITRLEFSNGLVADLGPDTQIMLAPDTTVAGKRQQAAIYARQGWIKISAVPAPEVGKTEVLTEAMKLSGITGSVVFSVQGKDSQLFVESGAATVTELNAGNATAPVLLTSGSFLAKSGVEQKSIRPHPTATFVAAVPRAFLDTIPLRANQFKDKPDPPLKFTGTLSYAQALPWLRGEAMLKAILIRQWQADLGADLRAGLTGNIKQHPEWHKVLFPEKPALATHAWSGASH